jgi:phosphoenolpyruvate carboxylase
MGPEVGPAGPARSVEKLRGSPPGDEAPPALRRDVRVLGSVLGRVLEESGEAFGGPELLADVERLRRATIALRNGEAWGPWLETDPRPRDEPGPSLNGAATRNVAEIVASFDLGRAEAVARAFTVWFQLVNLAEERHRVRTLRERSRTHGPISDSLAATVPALRDRIGADAMATLLERLEVAPVLTAHPTEARRRAVVEALGRISHQVARLDDPRLSQVEEAEVHRRLLEEVSILWRTAQLRDDRPTPLDEVRSVMAVFDETLFRVVPQVYRDLDLAELDPPAGPAPEDPEQSGRRLRSEPGARPSSVRPFLRFGSWVGGDRDGNPYVTAEVTRATMGIQADHVLRGLEAAARRIGRSLTATDRTTPPSIELLASLATDEKAFPRAGRQLRTRAPHEPHRRKLLLVAERLAATREEAGGGYGGPEELIADLRLLQRSLDAAGAARLAWGELQHLVWQAETFGFHFASLEIRQHSGVHAAALDELAPGISGDLAALIRLAREGGAAPPPGACSAQTEEVLATMRTVAELQQQYGPEACRRYVISFTRSAADLLAVPALARLAVPEGVELDVVPLFESRADLEAARSVLEELAGADGAWELLTGAGRRFEVMLGYSDSAKDVGFLAANLALYRAQAELAGWAADQDIDLVLFHGRGGALGRGGGPAHRAVRGQAPGSVNGRFKITEQGEVVFARYGNIAIARRHLQQVASAVLQASAPPADPPWEPPAEMIDRMAAASESAWRDLVDTPGFPEFFLKVSPLEELALMPIGSRPARRDQSTDDIRSLRAIPWVFAWNQNRCNLPGWYGLGTGLAAVALDERGLEALREMYRRWPFFTSLMENAEMSLAKADAHIARLYLDLGGRPELADAIEAELARTTRLVLAVTGHNRLLEDRAVLRQAVSLRNPYVDALSFLQLRFLGELRHGDLDPARRAKVAELVLLTVNGVAAGLQNTG